MVMQCAMQAHAQLFAAEKATGSARGASTLKPGGGEISHRPIKGRYQMNISEALAIILIDFINDQCPGSR